ncbi:MAG TPA: membrane protein insertase YidC [Roseimicrobium sp.]|nr:membrane protein insertase YidC [Roseimicrobium sp.]
MDRKSLAILVVSFALLLGWFPLMSKLYPPPAHVETTETNSVAGAETVLSNGVATLSAASTNSIPVSAVTPSATAQKEELLSFDSGDVIYTFTTHGGGVKRIELKKYPASVSCSKDMKQTTNGFAVLNDRSPVPMFTLQSGEPIHGDGVFRLTKTEKGVRAEKQLANGMSVVKEFTPGTNYQLTVSTHIENRGSQALPLPAQEWVIGTSTPLGVEDESMYLGLVWFDGASDNHIGESWFANRFLGCFPGTPRTVYDEGGDKVVWAAVHNQFFAVAAWAQKPAKSVVSRRVDLTPPTEADIAAHPKAMRNPHGYQTALVFPSSVLAPGKSVEEQFTVYAGPKEYNELSKLGAQQKNEVERVMNYSGFFGWFAKGLLLSMNGLHSLGASYGWSIVIITTLIKLIFWPLTTASTRSMKRMGALQPQMNALKEKYKDDPQKQNTKLMEFMRENKVNPMAGCIPMVVQIPVFFGFFRMLQGAIELRGAEFLWICDLSHPDTIAVIPGIQFPINPMPILMGITMLWQARLTPPSPGMDPVQQKIMKYMPLMFLVFLYNFSAALTVYWTVQNILTITQMTLTKTKDVEPAAATTPAPKKKK